MFQKGFASPKSRVLCFILFGILFIVIGASFTAIAYNSRIPTAQAAPALQEPDLPNAPEGYASRNCIISDIFVDNVRVHVKCTVASPAGVYFFAIPADAAHQTEANRFLALANTALVINTSVNLVYDTDTAHNPAGCAAGDCRLLTAVSLLAP